MSDNLKVLHVLPTLKKDGAEVQFANLLMEIKNTEIDIFTFDLYEKGDSIRPMLKNNNLFFKNSLTAKSFNNNCWYLFFSAYQTELCSLDMPSLMPIGLTFCPI